MMRHGQHETGLRLPGGAGSIPGRGSGPQRIAFDGARCSVVGFGGVQHVFAAAVPRRGRDAEAQLRDALRMLGAVLEEVGARDSVVQQTVFLADAGDLDPCRAIVRGFFRGAEPATSYVCQPPAGGQRVTVEVWAVGRGEPEVGLDRLSERAVRVRHDGLSWVHCGGIASPCSPGAVYDGARAAFAEFRALLAGAGTRLDQVVRTWLYLGDIVGPEADTQRYKELNRARADAYDGADFLADLRPRALPGPSYPASTGIGADGHALTLGGLALTTRRRDVRTVPLENPRQVSAFDYAERYSPRSPKFARAVAVAAGDDATILVSGTASITASETRHVDDPVAQAHETIDNIEALIAEDNLARHHLPGLGATPDDLVCARVYVKRPEDLARVRSACEARLPGVPTLYTLADVCRPELLVEIEGIAVTRR